MRESRGPDDGGGVIGNSKGQLGLSPSHWLPWAVGAVCALVAFGVFGLPWLVPVAIKPIVSDSQALGFNNRVAMVALLTGCVVVGLLALAWRARPAAEKPASTAVVLLEPAPKAERVGRASEIAAAVLVALFVGATAFISRNVLASDAAYFADRLQYLVNGGRFYVDFEFAYGPLMLYPAYLFWLVLKPFGASVYVGYYLFVLVLQVVGVFILTYLLDHLDMPRFLRRTVFWLTVPVMLLCTPSIGPNYAFARFLAPFFFVVWTLVRLERGGRFVLLVPFVSTAVALAISPEMGTVTGLSIAIALAFGSSRRDRAAWFAGVIAVATSAGGWLLYNAAKGSALVGFASGNAYFPALPSGPAIAYVASMLCLAWGVGSVIDLRDRVRHRALVGWLVVAGALAIPALGRADWVHYFWNGLGAMLLVSALMWRTARRFAPGAVVALGATFLVAASGFLLVDGTKSMFATGVNSGAISVQASKGVAHRIGRRYGDGASWWKKYRTVEPRSVDIAELQHEGSVFVTSWLTGGFGEALARSGSLVTAYELPSALGTLAQTRYAQRDLGTAKSVLISVKQYDGYRDRLADARKNHWGAMRKTKVATSSVQYALLPGLPLNVRPANPTLDSEAVFARTLMRDWKIEKRSGDYFILRRR